MDNDTPTTEPPVQYATSAAPPGCAIVEHFGWDAGGRFTALLVFPNGPPDLSFNVVWQAQPVRLTVDRAEALADAPTHPEPHVDNSPI